MDYLVITSIHVRDKPMFSAINMMSLLYKLG